jgi:hypothetical protein
MTKVTRVGQMPIGEQILKCNTERCTNEVTGGFKHEVDASDSGMRATVKDAWSATFWCKGHENDPRRNLRGSGRNCTDEEIEALKKVRYSIHVQANLHFRGFE